MVDWLISDPRLLACIQIARISPLVGNSLSASSGFGPSLQVEVEKQIYTDYYVLSASPFGEDLLVLTYPADEAAADGEKSGEALHESQSPSQETPSAFPPPPSAAGRPLGHSLVAQPGRRPQLRIVSSDGRWEETNEVALPASLHPLSFSGSVATNPGRSHHHLSDLFSGL